MKFGTVFIFGLVLGLALAQDPPGSYYPYDPSTPTAGAPPSEASGDPPSSPPTVAPSEPPSYPQVPCDNTPVAGGYPPVSLPYPYIPQPNGGNSKIIKAINFYF